MELQPYGLVIPSDILAKVTAFIGFYLLCVLWLCGTWIWQMRVSLKWKWVLFVLAALGHLLLLLHFWLALSLEYRPLFLLIGRSDWAAMSQIEYLFLVLPLGLAIAVIGGFWEIVVGLKRWRQSRQALV